MGPPKVDAEMAFAMQNTFLGINTCRREGEVGNLQSQLSKGSVNSTGSSEGHRTPVPPAGPQGAGSSCPHQSVVGCGQGGKYPHWGEASLHLRQLGRSCELLVEVMGCVDSPHHKISKIVVAFSSTTYQVMARVTQSG